MANLEIQIGADNSELNKKIAEAEKDLKELSQIKIDQIKLGLDTKEIDANIKDVKKHLADLKGVLKDTGNSFQGTQKPIADAGNTLNNFSRIAQDAPFGIMGIGNNITATAEAFSALSKQSGGAGNALKAVASSLAGPGGVLLAVSLVTTALTVMSQQGLTIGNVFEKLTGTFDQFKADLQEVNKEAAKNAAEQVASVGAYVSAAKNINLSMKDRLIAVQKLQDEYPAFFGNLTKEQILNGNIANAVKDVTNAIKQKARAQALSAKLGDLAAKEIDLREKEAPLIELFNNQLKQRNELEKQYGDLSKSSDDRDRARLAAARGSVIKLGQELKAVQDDIRANWKEQDKWTEKINESTAASIELEFKEPKGKKAKKIIDTPQVEPIDLKIPVKGITFEKFDLTKELNNQTLDKKTGIFSSMAERMEADRNAFLARMQAQAQPIADGVAKFADDLNTLAQNSFVDVFGSLGDAIGTALANGANVLSAVGASIIGSLGKFLSDMGGLLIQYGTLAVLKGKLDLAILTGGPIAISAGIAAIAAGVALKAAGGALGSFANGGTKGGGNTKGVSAGNSVSTPSSSVGVSQTNGGLQNVVFEISGQSLIGVLSNTLNKNVKLGGTITI